MWVLIIFAHVGTLGQGNSNALTNIPGFVTEAQCVAAGKAAERLSDGSTKVIKTVCVAQPK